MKTSFLHQLAKKLIKNIPQSIKNWSKNKLKCLNLGITRVNLRKELIQEKVIIKKISKSDNFYRKTGIKPIIFKISEISMYHQKSSQS